MFDHFVTMGFTEKMVSKAIQEIGKATVLFHLNIDFYLSVHKQSCSFVHLGEENADLILETLLTYQVIPLLHCNDYQFTPYVGKLVHNLAHLL